MKRLRTFKFSKKARILRQRYRYSRYSGSGRNQKVFSLFSLSILLDTETYGRFSKETVFALLNQ